jgi:hypothetical protein
VFHSVNQSFATKLKLKEQYLSVQNRGEIRPADKAGKINLDVKKMALLIKYSF